MAVIRNQMDTISVFVNRVKETGIRISSSGPLMKGFSGIIDQISEQNLKYLCITGPTVTLKDETAIVVVAIRSNYFRFKIEMIRDKS